MKSSAKCKQTRGDCPAPAAEGLSGRSCAKHQFRQTQAAASCKAVPAQVAGHTTVRAPCIAAQNAWAKLMAGRATWWNTLCG